MDILLIESYDKPNYKSFELKTGLKLPAGVAATAMLMACFPAATTRSNP